MGEERAILVSLLLHYVTDEAMQIGRKWVED